MRPTEEQKVALGAEIKRLREEMGIGKAELARRVSALTHDLNSGQSVTNWEKGVYAPKDYNTIHALERVLCPNAPGQLRRLIADDVLDVPGAAKFRGITARWLARMLERMAEEEDSVARSMLADARLGTASTEKREDILTNELAAAMTADDIEEFTALFHDAADASMRLRAPDYEPTEKDQRLAKVWKQVSRSGTKPPKATQPADDIDAAAAELTRSREVRRRGEAEVAGGEAEAARPAGRRGSRRAD